MMARFEHIRHRPPRALMAPRELLLVVSPLRSSVNLSRMVRLAGCCGLPRIVHCGSAKIDAAIAREAVSHVQLETHRSLNPVLVKLRQQGYPLVGLEQTTGSQSLYDFRFARRTALVVGSEREGLLQSTLDLLDAVVEIPVYGIPASYNVVTATTMAVYEYCRQFPDG
jgi:tRNA G18 (ribose-2'-O)-methylase SpoU